jgi:hypothetical protein
LLIELWPLSLSTRVEGLLSGDDAANGAFPQCLLREFLLAQRGNARCHADRPELP